MLIDTHAHIYLPEFAEDMEEVLKRAEEAGVEEILLPNIDINSIEGLKALVTKYKGCKGMMGLHPCSVKEDYKLQLDRIEKELRTGSYIGVGEIGTDLYWDKTFWEEQKSVFNYQLDLAREMKLPVAIHCRETLDETIELVRNAKPDLSGVFHCFTGTMDQYKAITDLGFYVGLGGVTTFKNSGMSDTLKQMDLSNVILETDSPYLTPHPFRGKRNEPSYIYNIALNLAQVRGIPFKEIETITSENAKRLFNLK